MSKHKTTCQIISTDTDVCSYLSCILKRPQMIRCVDYRRCIRNLSVWSCTSKDHLIVKSKGNKLHALLSSYIKNLRQRTMDNKWTFAKDWADMLSYKEIFKNNNKYCP